MHMTFTKAIIVATALSAPITRADHARVPAPIQLCWQPAGHTAEMVTAVRSYVSATDAQSVQFRSRVGLLQDSADSVYLVTDDSVCRRGAVALAVLKGNPDTVNVYPVLVIKAGRARYVLDDGATKGGEFMASYVADTAFQILGGIAN